MTEASAGPLPQAPCLRWCCCLFLLSILATAFAQAEGDPLPAARERWRAVDLRDYEYSYRKFCDCQRNEPPRTTITVSGGRIAAVVHRHNDSDRLVPARDGSLEYYWSIDDLFDLLESARDNGAIVRASFDRDRGYPTEIYIDYSERVVGDEIDLRSIGLNLSANR